MRSAAGRRLGLALLSGFVCVSGTAGGEGVVFVPWKVVARGAPAANAPFILYWIPSSPDEMRRSKLVNSRPLWGYAGRCVAMQVVRVDDGERIRDLRATRSLPVALLMDGAREIARATNRDGSLLASDVEEMVGAALDARESAIEAQLDEARRLATDGDTATASAMYRQVAAQRCAFPRLARDAQRALKKIGSR